MPTDECCYWVVWSPEELLILKDVAINCRGTGAPKYILYQKKCRNKGIPDRSLKAFLRKLGRMFSRQRN